MKLESIAIRNFRGIGPADGLSFPEQTVQLQHIDMSSDRILIVGPNNAGKSSVLAAYEFFVTQKQKAVAEDFFAKDENHQILIEAKIRASDAELEDEQVQRWFSNNVAIVRKVWNSSGAEGQKYTFDPDEGDWVVDGFGGWDSILQSKCPEPIWIKGFSDPEEIISQLQSLIREAVFSHLSDKEEYQTAEDALSALRDIIEGDDYVSDMASKISSSVREFFPDAEISIENPVSDKGIVPLFDKQAKVNIAAEHSPPLPFDRHGHGLQRQLVLSALQGAAAELAHIKLAKAQRNRTQPDATRPRILLIEEPELFLSPPSVRIMKRVIKKISELDMFQVMAATHSPMMVDLSADRQTIVRMAKGDNGSKYYQVASTFFDRDEKTTLRTISTFNSYHSECIFYDRVLIVEGATEVAAFKALSERYFNEKEDPNLLKAHVVTFGGKRDIPVLQRVLRHLQIPYVVVHDLDDLEKNADIWNCNFEIGEEVDTARAQGLSAVRVALGREFEDAHGYTSNRKSKQIDALNYVNALNLDEDVEVSPVLKLGKCLSEGTIQQLHMDNEQIKQFDFVCRVFRGSQ